MSDNGRPSVERRGYREAMGKMIKDLRDQGMSYDKARQVTRDAALVADRKGEEAKKTD